MFNGPVCLKREPKARVAGTSAKPENMRRSLLSPRAAFYLDPEIREPPASAADGLREPPASSADGLSSLDEQLEATLDKVISFKALHPELSRHLP